MRLKGKNCIVTGGTRGIGRAIAIAFAKEGANVAFTYHNRAEFANDIIAQLELCDIKCTAIKADLAKISDVSRIIEESYAALGNIDVLVNNAGICNVSPFVDIFEEEFSSIIDINLKAPFFLSQYTARHMIENKTKGSIINISSISAFRAEGGLAHYEVSKAGLSMLTKSTALELSGYGIRVNTISPGYTKTDMTKDVCSDRIAAIPFDRMGEPDEIAQGAVYLASDESAYMTGSDLVIDGGEVL